MNLKKQKLLAVLSTSVLVASLATTVFASSVVPEINEQTVQGELVLAVPGVSIPEDMDPNEILAGPFHYTDQDAIIVTETNNMDIHGMTRGEVLDIYYPGVSWSEVDQHLRGKSNEYINQFVDQYIEPIIEAEYYYVSYEERHIKLSDESFAATEELYDFEFPEVTPQE